MIGKLVVRNVAATKGRLLLMLLSIVLGVSFVSGSFLLADSLRAVFAGVSEQIYAGVDVQVRGVEGDLASGEDDARFDDSVFAKIENLPEVAFAEAGLFAFEQLFTVGADGEANRPNGPPVFSSSWVGPSPVSSWSLVDGRAPVGQEIAIDVVQAENHGLEIGQRVAVASPVFDEPVEVTIVGTVTFGDLRMATAPYFNLFDLETIQTLLGAEGLIDGINVSAASGVSNAQVVDAVEQAYGYDPRLEAVTGTTLVDEQNAEFDDVVTILGNVLLGFAVAVLFVSVFIIYNTFAIMIGQRIRQFGLLRSIGMTGQQLRSMVLVEALVIGIAASVLGLFGGIGIAEFLKALFEAASGGNGFPDGPLVFKARTVLIVFVLGIGVTLGSALLPAWLAQRIPALAALREGAAARETSRSRRIAIGTSTLALGVGLTLWGLFGSLAVSPRLAALGVGAALLFIGVAALSVLFASGATRVIGAPVEAARGLTGRLGRDNASRNPQRTAATATALMIGLALITGVLVLTQSLRATFERILDETVAADLFVYQESQGLAFAATAVDQIGAVPGIDDVAGVSEVRVRIDSEVERAAGFDVASQDRVLDIQLSEGTYAVGDTGLLVYRDEADEQGLTLGDQVEVVFEDDVSAKFTIVGIYDDNTLVGSSWVFDRAVTASHANVDGVGFIGATVAPGADPTVVQEAVSDAIANFPQLVVQDNTEFKETQEGQIAQFLALIFGLLALCIVVAFIGIVNTMALSILERTREIGLLRAIGTSRRQLRSMVRWEAIIVGVFGALLGIVLGLVIGYAAVTAIPDSFISEVAIPWRWAIAFTVIGGLLGMLAAVFPARRAARMDVLEAISTQ